MPIAYPWKLKVVSAYYSPVTIIFKARTIFWDKSSKIYLDEYLASALENKS